jgi:hypothetical protein
VAQERRRRSDEKAAARGSAADRSAARPNEETIRNRAYERFLDRGVNTGETSMTGSKLNVNSAKDQRRRRFPP